MARIPLGGQERLFRPDCFVRSVVALIVLGLLGAGPPGPAKQLFPADPADITQQRLEAEAWEQPRPRQDDPEAIRILASAGCVRGRVNGFRDSLIVTDPSADLAKLMPSVRRLASVRGLRFVRATDGQLVLVKALPELMVLQAMGGNLTDAGLVNLKGASKLTILLLQGNRKITSAGFAHLRRLKEVRSLNLAQTHIGDAGLDSLKEMKKLLSLDISQTELTDLGMKELKAMSELQYLSLANTQVGDGGLQHISHLTAMRSLCLDSTAVTDAGLTHLKHMRELREITFRSTKVTRRGVKPLSELNPWIQITVGNGDRVSGVGKEPVAHASSGRRGPEGQGGSHLNAEAGCSPQQVPADEFEAVAILRRAGCHGSALNKHVESVEVTSRAVSPATLASCLKVLPKLRELRLVDAADGLPFGPSDDPEAVAFLSRHGCTLGKANGRVCEAIVAGRADSGKMASCLRSLHGLSMLQFRGPTDSQLALVKDLTGLTSLMADGTEVTDAGLPNLEGLVNLAILDLHGNRKITGAGCASPPVDEDTPSLSRLHQRRRGGAGKP